MFNAIQRGIEHFRSQGALAFGRAAIGYPFNLYQRARYGPGIDVMEEDWDNLILLDACRHDYFADVNWLNGDLQHRISRGAMSREFITRNFAGRRLHDTVYITANTFVGHVEQDVFYGVISVLDDWDPELQTVPPNVVVERVLEEYPKYDDKRLIVHLMQPHQPYLGNTADKIRTKITGSKSLNGMTSTVRGDNADVFTGYQRNQTAEGDRSGNMKMFEAVEDPDIDVTHEDILTAYRETLTIALEQVERLLDNIEGKTVISADHGELLRERPNPARKPMYGHPIGQYSLALRKVPWFVAEFESRRTITSELPEIYETPDNVEEKLEALGYR